VCKDCSDIITRSTPRDTIYCADCFGEMLHYGVSDPLDLAMEADFGYA
jgi:hypothetical protein